MAQKVFVDATEREILRGYTLVDGTEQEITMGKTLVDGTEYDILFYKKVTVQYEYNTTPSSADYGSVIIDGAIYSSEFGSGTYVLKKKPGITISASIKPATSGRTRKVFYNDVNMGNSYSFEMRGNVIIRFYVGAVYDTILGTMTYGDYILIHEI